MKNSVFTIQRNSGKSNSFLQKNKSFGQSLFALLILTVMLSWSSMAQDCSLSLTALNNIESVNNGERVYFLTLKNNTAEEIVVNFSASNHNVGMNPDSSNVAGNVNLNAAILNNSGQAITNSIILTANELLSFQVKVSVPTGTTYEHWNIMLLNASSDKCLNYSTSLSLYTYIPTPVE